MSIDFQKALSSRIAVLQHHPLYPAIQTIEHLRLFMETHVYAVWDFMCLLKALQRAVTCVEIPWVPRGEPETRRLINEIVLGEESDETPSGHCSSHFELYLAAMSTAGADTRSINTFWRSIREGHLVHVALEYAEAPAAAKEFVLHTMDIAHMARPHAIAAAFAYGREQIIPDMFSGLLHPIDSKWEPAPSLELFNYYLERHMQLDGEEHGQLAQRMLANLCAEDPEREREALAAAESALEARDRLWNAVLKEITDGN